MYVYRKEKWLLLIPALAIIFAVFVAPLAYSVASSLTSRYMLRPELGTRFVGLRNYQKFFTDNVGLIAVRNTLTFTFGGIPVQLALGLYFALLLRRELPGIRLFRVALVIPMVVSPLVRSYGWLMIFQPSMSPISALFRLFRSGWTMPALLTSSKTVMPALITVSTWAATPFVTLVLLAALQSLPKEPFECALIDGASRWQSFWYLTLPMLKPSILVIMLIRIMQAMRAFAIFFVMTGGGPGRASEVLSFLNYRVMFHQFNQGYASAISVITLTMIFVLCIILHRLTITTDERSR